MSWREMLAAPVAVGIVAMLGGVGVLAWRIGGTWDGRNTDALVMGAIMTCFGGVFLVCLLLGVIVGVPLALRVMESRSEAREMAMDMRLARMAERYDTGRLAAPRDDRRMIEAPYNVLPQDARPLLAPPADGMPGGAPGWMGGAPGYKGVPFDGLDSDDKFSGDW